jgi:hypothetical protein
MIQKVEKCRMRNSLKTNCLYNSDKNQQYCLDNSTTQQQKARQSAYFVRNSAIAIKEGKHYTTYSIGGIMRCHHIKKEKRYETHKQNHHVALVGLHAGCSGSHRL